MSVGSNPAFPIIPVPYEIHAYVTNHLNIAMSRKFLRIKIRFSTKIIKLIQLLHNLGVIKSFKVSRSNLNYFITLSPFFYKSSTFFKQIKLISTSSKKFYISYRGLSLVAKSTGHSIYILSTSRGLLTHVECLRLKIGGILLWWLY